MGKEGENNIKAIDILLIECFFMNYLFLDKV